jgi:hypothetical protein
MKWITVPSTLLRLIEAPRYRLCLRVMRCNTVGLAPPLILFNTQCCACGILLKYDCYAFDIR